MVERALNTPAAKIGNLPASWLTEFVTAEWFCSNCKMEQPKGSICYERTLRYKGKIKEVEKPVDLPLRRFLCLDCATKLLDEESTNVSLIKGKGKKGYRLFKEI